MVLYVYLHHKEHKEKLLKGPFKNLCVLCGEIILFNYAQVLIFTGR